MMGLQHIVILLMQLVLTNASAWRNGRFTMRAQGSQVLSSPNRPTQMTTHNLRCAEMCFSIKDCYEYVISTQGNKCQLRIYGVDLDQYELPADHEIRYKVSLSCSHLLHI